ncbi:hypothetical protein P7K49_000297 [Saguinus oedipus]|uniref:Uncharacterized protein n=1 Tax=Saguinus oedipus TaxID=9490 RepID=A0ABQ9WC33_SAGOE|nr:hypothetical protein P7K49_000297 [Saguinus oedipus]
MALQASAAVSRSRPPVSGKKHRSAGPLFCSSDTLPATSAHSRDSAQASSSAPTQPAQGTTAHSAAGAFLLTTSTSSPRTKRKSTRAADLARNLPDPSSASPTTTLARQRVSGPTSVLKLPVTAAATTQPKPVVLHGQQQGTRTLKQFHPYSHPAASAAAQASSSAPTQPAQGTTTHSASGVSLPTTSTWTITQPKPVVLHGQQQGTRTLKRFHPYSHPAASVAAQASISGPTQPAQSTTAHSAAGVSLPTTSTWSLASNPSSASLITALARLRISGPTSVLKLPVTAAATTQPKPVVLHGQQQGTRTLKRPHPSSHPAASAAARASFFALTRTAQGTTAHSATGVSLPTTSTWSLAGTLSNQSSASHTTTLARQRVSGFALLQKLAAIAAAITQPKPVVLHGQKQGTRTLKQFHPYSHPAASAAAQASVSAPTQPAQGITAHSATGVSLPTTSIWSLAGTFSNPSSSSLRDAHAASSDCTPAKVRRLC